MSKPQFYIKDYLETDRKKYKPIESNGILVVYPDGTEIHVELNGGELRFYKSAPRESAIHIHPQVSNVFAVT